VNNDMGERELLGVQQDLQPPRPKIIQH